MAKRRSKDLRIPGDPSKPTIFILHGFGSNPRQALLWGNFFAHRNYEVVANRARGHGGREGTVYRWFETIQDHNKFITEKIHRPTVVIGHSMGGTMAISLAKNRYVKKVFAISAIHSQKLFDDPDLKKQMIMEKYHISRKRAERSIMPALPQYVSLTPFQSKKLYLIHDRYDYYVPYEHFLMNKQKYHVPKSHTLVVHKLRHSLTPNDQKVLRFILLNIEGK